MMWDEVADAAPDTEIPDLLIDAPIVAHAELCARAVWNVPRLLPMQRKALDTLFSKNNKEKKTGSTAPEAEAEKKTESTVPVAEKSVVVVAKKQIVTGGLPGLSSAPAGIGQSKFEAAPAA